MIAFPYVFMAIFVLAIGGAAVVAAQMRLRLPFGFGLCLASGMVAFAGLRGAGLDYYEYVTMFDVARRAAGEAVISRVLVGKDILFGAFLLVLVELRLSPVFMFVGAAALSVFAKLYAFRVAFGSGVLGLAIYFFSYYFLHDFTQVRAAIAIAFCFCALVFLVRGSVWLYLLFAAVAVGFHIQAAIFLFVTLPLIVGLRRGWKWLVLAVLLLVVVAPTLLWLGILYDGRGGIDVTGEAFGRGAIPVAVLRIGLVAMAYFGCRREMRSGFERDLAAVAFVLVVAGFVFFLATFGVSAVFAWRIAEMFMSFSVFVFVAAVRSGMARWSLPSLVGYVGLNSIVLLRGPLLVDYVLMGN